MGLHDKKRPKIFCNPFIYYSFGQKTFRWQKTTFIAVLIAPLKRVRRRIISVGSAKTVIAILGSSVKYVDTFRIVLKEEPKSCVKQIDSQDCLGCLFYLSSDTEYLTILTHRKFGDKILKSHDIISNKTSKIKWKNTYKKQVCNQQKINWLWSRTRKGAW